MSAAHAKNEIDGFGKIKIKSIPLSMAAKKEFRSFFISEIDGNKFLMKRAAAFIEDIFFCDFFFIFF